MLRSQAQLLLLFCSHRRLEAASYLLSCRLRLALLRALSFQSSIPLALAFFLLCPSLRCLELVCQQLHDLAFLFLLPLDGVRTLFLLGLQVALLWTHVPP